MYDLEGSNDVDPLVSGFSQIYLTVKHICPVVLLSVLIFSKPTRACAGIPSSKHVCRPLALARPTPCILVQRLTQGVPIISTLPRSPLAVAINAPEKEGVSPKGKTAQEEYHGRRGFKRQGFASGTWLLARWL